MEPPEDVSAAATDLYGFELPNNITAQTQAIRMKCDGAALRAEHAWSQHVEEGRLPGEARLKELIRKGVPPTLRQWVWMEVSGAARRKAAMSPSYFAGMAAAGEAGSQYLKQIDQDVRHAFQNHPWLRSAEGLAALRRVLAAFAAHNPQAGYTRTLSHIVALLLVALNRNQETAFWLLVQLVEGTLYAGTYSPDLAGCQVEMGALEELIGQKLPRLAAHLAALEADVSVIATDWYLSLFATSMPSETVARVWDAMMNEGPKVLFRVALALLSTNEDALLAFDNAGEMIIFMRTAAAAAHDRDRLMRAAFEGVGSLPMAVIDRYRGQSSREVEAALRDRQSGTRPSATGHVTGAQQHGGVEELREKAGVLGAVAAAGLRKGWTALVRAAAGGDDGGRRGSAGGPPAAV